MKVSVRKAKVDDIYSIVQLIHDDVLRKLDSSTILLDKKEYQDFFKRIDRDENQFLMVVENEHGDVIGTSHLTLLHYIPFCDRRVMVEFVRVRKDVQGKGIGRMMFEWIKEKAVEWEASRIQLTTDKRRLRAKLFYESLGYQATHEGMKLFL